MLSERKGWFRFPGFWLKVIQTREGALGSFNRVIFGGLCYVQMVCLGGKWMFLGLREHRRGVIHVMGRRDCP